MTTTLLHERHLEEHLASTFAVSEISTEKVKHDERTCDGCMSLGKDFGNPSVSRMSVYHLP